MNFLKNQIQTDLNLLVSVIQRAEQGSVENLQKMVFEIDKKINEYSNMILREPSMQIRQINNTKLNFFNEQIDQLKSRIQQVPIVRKKQLLETVIPINLPVEETVLKETESFLDNFISIGRDSLTNLVEQRNILKSTRRKMLSAANTIGLSRNVMRYIENRNKQDLWLFCFLIILTIVILYFVL